jgi:hypothetical protein
VVDGVTQSATVWTARDIAFLNVRSPDWRPTQFLRFERSIRTSTRACVIMTDAGEAFIKGLGNPVGPHALACEWIGTELAAWFGLRTFHAALMVVQDTCGFRKF